MKWNLKTKLISSFLALAAIPIALLFASSLSTITSGNRALVEEDIESTTHSINASIDQVAARLLAVAEVDAARADLQEAVKSGDRARIAQNVKPLFEEARASNSVSVFEIGDKQGKVLFRGHNPEKYGDDKSDTPAIQKALQGESIGGMEFGASGISVRAFVPLLSGNEVIGTLQLSADDSFLDELNHTLGVELSFYDASGVLVKSNHEEEQSMLGQPVLSAQQLAQIEEKGTLTLTTDDGYMDAYSPLYDPSKTQLIGVVKYSKDISAIVSMREDFIRIASVLGAVVLIVSAAVALLLTRSITKPVYRVSEFMKRISKGDLRHTYEGKIGKDELGTLANSAVEMSNQLRTMIVHIQATSQQVAHSSEELSEQTSQMAAASREVAESMSVLSTGAESQMQSAEQTAKAAIEMSAGMTRIADSSAEVAELAQEAEHKVNAGNEGVQRAASQMQSIRESISVTAATIHELNEKASHIDQIVVFIKELSEQVNLLSLNASIEAARAGEYGRGFAVVAHEIKKLATQTQASAEQISEYMIAVQQAAQRAAADMARGVHESEHGIIATQNAGSALGEIWSAVSQVTSRIEEVSAVTEQISAGTQQVSATMAEMAGLVRASGEQTVHVSSLTQEQLASAEEMTASADQLREMSEQLKQLTDTFKL